MTDPVAPRVAGRAMRVTAGGAGVELAAAPVREPGPGQVLLDVTACGICGSDLHLLASGTLEAGTVLGHEIAGTVAATGPGAAIPAGTPVAVFPFVPCGACEQCLAGAPHLCGPALGPAIGLGREPGGFADHLLVAESQAVPLPPGLDPRLAALAEPLAVALHAVGLAAAAPEAEVLVLGAGAIGLFAAEALRARGHERIIVVDPSPTRSGRAARMGFGVSVPRGARLRTVIECAGHPEATKSALRHVAPAGTVVLVGVFYEPLEISQVRVITKEIVVRGSFAYTRAEFEEALALLAAGAIRHEEIVTATGALAELPALLSRLRDAASGEVKILVTP